MRFWYFRAAGLALVVGLVGFSLLSGRSHVANESPTITLPALSATTTSTATELPAAALEAAAGASELVSADVALDTALAVTRSAIVNVLCQATTKSPFKSISGSGVILTPSGVILTAAHIAQYFLLMDYPKDGSVSCVIRTGSPARDTYYAELIFISPTWIVTNPRTLLTNTPMGTGEHDFALLAITKSATRTRLPTSFPHIPLVDSDIHTGEPVVMGTYGAQFLTSTAVQSSLSPTVIEGLVQKLYTFHRDSIDLISLGGSIAAQEGSSGGAVANAAGELVGLITTSSTEGAIATRDLHAITPAHLRASFVADMNIDLDSYLANTNLKNLVSNFSARAELLTDVLVNTFKENN